MKDEYVYLWAQWGALSSQLYKVALLRFGSLERAWREVRMDFFYAAGMSKQKVERLFAIRECLSFYDIVSMVERYEARVLCLGEPDYPFLLSHISVPPPFLFVRGQIPLGERSIGVVGTRKITDYGTFVTRKFTSALVEAGFAIVSGLAMGVDTCAHQTALDGGGITVAVLGCGVDQVYPLSNQRLADDILKSGGALVSAYPLGTPPLKHHFPERNLIIAGLSRGVLVTEGGEKSGAVITAKEALNENREVFAVPNNINKTALSGTNKLIRLGTAKLVEEPIHVLEEFDSHLTLAKNEEHFKEQSFTGDESRIFELLKMGGGTLDDLSQKANVPVQRLSVLLTNLSLKGVAHEEGVKWSYSL